MNIIINIVLSYMIVTGSLMALLAVGAVVVTVIALATK